MIEITKTMTCKKCGAKKQETIHPAQCDVKTWAYNYSPDWRALTLEGPKDYTSMVLCPACSEEFQKMFPGEKAE